MKRWLNTTGGWLITTNTYDDLGNLRSTKDPGNHTTTFSYTDDWADSHCPLANTQAYVTLTTNALGHRNANRYFTCTGLVQSSRDENDIVMGRAGTTFTYDIMNRPLVTVYPDNGQTTNSYNDTSLPASVATLTKIDDSKNLSQTTVFDGLGRTQQTRLVDPDCAVGPVKVDFTYDLFGRKATESNPYCTSGESTSVTAYKYDVLGRVIRVIPPDGTESSNHVSTAYSDNLATVTDQAGKVRRTKSDAFDRVVAVWEPNSAGSLVNQTVYLYDVMDNLRCVEQRGTGSSPHPCGDASHPADWRPRQFVYDSLSRLIKATNPESGTICYGVWNASQCINGYDVDGNLLAQTDARNITINHTYDQLHRLTGKTYSNGDASVTYCYDLASCTTLLSPIENGVGRRIRMTDGSGISAWSYDPMGRVKVAKQTILGITKSMSYDYNKIGSPLKITYPSGREIVYEYNAASRERSAKDTVNTVDYAKNAEYAPQGALRTVLLGNDFGNAGSTFTQTFNSRLQPDRIRAFNSSRTIIDLSYSFNLGVSNNGNVAGITNHRDNPSRPVGSVNFTYDELNRVSSVQTAGSDCTPIAGLTKNWGNAFVYDIWGNLLQKNQIKCTAEPLLVTVDNQNRLEGHSYDAAGNLLNDGLGISFTYDAENRLKTSGGTTTYTYDGEGSRVAKSGYRLYWWGTNGYGGPLAETFTSGGDKREYIYFAGRRIAMVDLSVSGNNCQGTPPNCARYYFYPDQVGSTAVLASSSGNTTVHEADFYPFGGERIITSSSIDPHYRFTGKERDDETDLDYFGARYHGSRLARFMSPDSPLLDQETGLPQSWNLYSYVRNNPINQVDPSGHETEVCQINFAGFEHNCGAFRDDDFREFKNRNKNTLLFADNGGVYTSDGQLIGTWQWNGPDIPRDAQAVLTSVERGAGLPVRSLAFTTMLFVAAYMGPALSTPAVGTYTRLNKSNAAAAIRNMSGMSKDAVRHELKSNGFRFGGRTKGGYEKWTHPDGSKVWIRPDGAIDRIPPGGGGWRVTPEGHKQRPHTFPPERTK